jgi:peptide/nickel transport system substrate-binding protein
MKDRQYADPPTLDMLTLNNPWYSTGYACYSSLVQYKPGVLEPGKLEWAPDLAESWEVSPDGLTINMKLRPSIKFHNKPPVNGRELDVDDVLFTWKRFSSEYSGRAGVVNAISPGAPVLSVTAPDAKTIQIKLAEPVYYALSLFVGSNGSGLWIIPKEAEDQSKLDLRGDMLGTGPWYMDDYTPSASFTLKRNEEYWDPDYALVDQIDLPIIAEYASALSQLQAGNIYYMGSHITTGVIQQGMSSPSRRTFRRCRSTP